MLYIYIYIIYVYIHIHTHIQIERESERKREREESGACRGFGPPASPKLTPAIPLDKILPVAV